MFASLRPLCLAQHELIESPKQEELMNMARIALLVLAASCWSGAYAEDNEKLVGLWKLISYELEFQDTGERQTPFGTHPNGYGVITGEGRTIAVLTAAGRSIPKSDADRAAAFKTVIAYTEMLKVEGDHWTTHVDVTWNEAWNGTDQVRFFLSSRGTPCTSRPLGRPT
jgi:hypothetical protein